LSGFGLAESAPGDGDEDGLVEGLTLADGLAEGLALADGLAEGLALADGFDDGLALWEGLADGEGVAVDSVYSAIIYVTPGAIENALDAGKNVTLDPATVPGPSQGSIQVPLVDVYSAR